VEQVKKPTSYITIAKAYMSVSLVRRALSKPNFSGKSNSGASQRTDQGSQHSKVGTLVLPSKSERKNASRKFARTAE